jgi:hypothetical protein
MILSAAEKIPDNFTDAGILLFLASGVVTAIGMSVENRQDEKEYRETIEAAILKKYPNAEKICFDDDTFYDNGNEYVFEAENVPNNWSEIRLKISQLTSMTDEIVIKKPPEHLSP